MEVRAPITGCGVHESTAFCSIPPILSPFQSDRVELIAAAFIENERDSSGVEIAIESLYKEGTLEDFLTYTFLSQLIY